MNAQVERPVTPRKPHVSPAGAPPTGARQQTVAGRTSGPASLWAALDDCDERFRDMHEQYKRELAIFVQAAS